MQNVLTEMANEISDISGLTGLAIIQAILDGERDRYKLADLAHGRLQATGKRLPAAWKATGARNCCSSCSRKGGLSPPDKTADLNRSLQPAARSEPQKEKKDELHHDPAEAIENDVSRQSGPVGQERLMKFVTAGNYCSSQQREKCVLQEGEARKAHPQSAQPCERHQSVAGEMAGLANVVMDQIPVPVADLPKEVFQEPA